VPERKRNKGNTDGNEQKDYQEDLDRFHFESFGAMPERVTAAESFRIVRDFSRLARQGSGPISLEASFLTG
jgi:hypothetical protein